MCSKCKFDFYLRAVSVLNTLFTRVASAFVSVTVTVYVLFPTVTINKLYFIVTEFIEAE